MADTDITINESDANQIDVKVAGADDFEITANTFTVLSGSTLNIASGATITNNGTVSGFDVPADNIQAGDAGVNITTTVGNITIDAQANDSDIIFKGTDGTADTTFLTLDGSDAGKMLPNNGIDLNGKELILDADADTSITADTDDQIDIRIAGADDFQFTADKFTAAASSGIVLTKTAAASDIATSNGVFTSNNYCISHTLTLNSAVDQNAEIGPNSHPLIITCDKVLATSHISGVCSLNCFVHCHSVVAGSFRVTIINKGSQLASDSTMIINYVIL